jgi:hypothetical protein
LCVWGGRGGEGRGARGRGARACARAFVRCTRRLPDPLRPGAHWPQAGPAARQEGGTKGFLVWAFRLKIKVQDHNREVRFVQWL